MAAKYLEVLKDNIYVHTHSLLLSPPEIVTGKLRIRYRKTFILNFQNTLFCLVLKSLGMLSQKTMSIAVGCLCIVHCLCPGFKLSCTHLAICFDDRLHEAHYKCFSTKRPALIPSDSPRSSRFCSLFLRRLRSDLTRSLLILKNELGAT